MCGRFTQHLSWEELQRLADLIGQPRNPAPRYNIAPTTQIEVIRPAAGGNELVPMRWGLVPLWWKKPLSELPSTFNARAETVAEKPMFRSAFKSAPLRHSGVGLLRMDRPQGREDAALLLGAGWPPARLRRTMGDVRAIRRREEPMDSATIIVGAANEWMERFHNRMPVILDWRDIRAWMAGDDPGALLRPPPEDALQEWIVSPRVNRSGVGDSDPTLVEPAVAA